MKVVVMWPYNRERFRIITGALDVEEELEEVRVVMGEGRRQPLLALKMEGPRDPGGPSKLAKQEMGGRRPRGFRKELSAGRAAGACVRLPLSASWYLASPFPFPSFSRPCVMCGSYKCDVCRFWIFYLVWQYILVFGWRDQSSYYDYGYLWNYSCGCIATILFHPTLIFRSNFPFLCFPTILDLMNSVSIVFIVSLKV